ncbi:AF4/FMR2 family member 1-like [Phyllostomus discolor]|uniref:AF4/FMR2 family member 1-like n=1 Tax=Phyllostomus discolor TaxID=89673 RepID=A0A7E6DXE8_9CHIR|nr:AF4/FMR2 family member 1-like [Phyllostomus discolor]
MQEEPAGISLPNAPVSPAPRRARPELFVNYISGAFIAPAPPTTEKPPPPPQTASCAPRAPFARRPRRNCSAGPEFSGSPIRDSTPEKGGERPVREVHGRQAVKTNQEVLERRDLNLGCPYTSDLRRPGLSPYHVLGAEAERKNRQKTEGDGQAGVRGSRHSLPPVAQGTMMRVQKWGPLSRQRRQTSRRPEVPARRKARTPPHFLPLPPEQQAARVAMKSLVLPALASGLQPAEGAGELAGWLFGATGVEELGQGCGF